MQNFEKFYVYVIYVFLTLNDTTKIVLALSPRKQRTNLIIESYRQKNTREIHAALQDVCDDNYCYIIIPVGYRYSRWEETVVADLYLTKSMLK